MKLKLTILIILTCFVTVAAENNYKVGDHELLMMPTAYTMPKGASYFTDYEILLLNYTHAITGRTHVGLFSLFPIIPQFVETFTFGLKQNYLRTNSLQLAAWIAYANRIEGVAFGNVMSINANRLRFHVNVGNGLTADSDGSLIMYNIGVEHRASDKLSFLAEYSNFSTLEETKTDGFLSAGFRLSWEKISWDLAGVKMLGVETGNLLYLPYSKVTFYFDGS